MLYSTLTRKENFMTNSSFRVISLSRNYVAIIDAIDYRKVNRYQWHVHISAGTKRKPGQPYARATISGKKVYLHRLIMNAPPEMHVDHANHQTLDCRRSNLEVVHHLINQSRRRNVRKVK